MTQAEESRKNKQLLLRLAPEVIATLRERAKLVQTTVSEYVAILVQGTK